MASEPGCRGKMGGVGPCETVDWCQKAAGILAVGYRDEGLTAEEETDGGLLAETGGAVCEQAPRKVASSGAATARRLRAKNN